MRLQEVGVVVPCYNQGRWLEQCLGSLHAQTETRWRAVVVDDASDDGETESVARRLAGSKVDVVRLRSNRGLSGARNEAVRRLADRQLVLTLDADDWLAPDYLETLWSALRAQPDAAAVHGTQVFFGERPFRTPSGTWPEHPFDASRRFVENPLPGAGVLWRAEALARLGGWREEFSGILEDWDLGLRLHASGGRHLWEPGALYHYRQHGASILNQWGRFSSARFDAKLLRNYRREIEAIHGAAAFAQRRLLPELLAALRAGRLSNAGRLLFDAGPLQWPMLASGILRQGSRARAGR